MAKKPMPSPKPMPTTSRPDRIEPSEQKDMNPKAGVLTYYGGMCINPGQKPHR